MSSEREQVEIKDRAAAHLLTLPGVVAVGLGSKEVRDEPTGELAIKVFVKVKRPLDELPDDHVIPAEIDGIPTDVIESGEIRPVVDPPGSVATSTTDDTRFRPLTGGGRIRREDSGYEGTVGCFLWDPGDHGKAFGVTNHHVLAVPDVPALAVGSSRVGQPSGAHSVTKCCSDLIGVFGGGGKSDDRDEALVRLAPGTQWRAEITEIGVVTGKHTVTQAEATPMTYKVRKRGARTKLTGGVVRALNATTHEADNVLMIKPNPNPAAGARTVYFDYEGDSGSAVVNDAREVVGLVWGRTDAGDGVAYAIQRVLDRFNSVEHVSVDIATAAAAGTVNTVPGAAMVATPPELAGVLGPGPRAAPRPAPLGWVPEPAIAPAYLQRDLDASPAGRLLITVWLEHQAELMSLVDGNRRVAVAWHRSGAGALVQTFARMTPESDIALPATINGQPLAACLDRVQAMFERYGTEKLARDLRRARRALPDCSGLTYRQIIDSLRAA